MEVFAVIRPNELVFAVTTLGISIADGKSNEDLALMSAIFMQLSDVLNTILAEKALIEKDRDEKKDTKSDTKKEPATN